MKRESQPALSVEDQQALNQYVWGLYKELTQVLDVSMHDLHHHFSYPMVEGVPSHRLAQIIGLDLPDPTTLSVRGMKQDLQQDVEKIAWI